jgi:rhodanese-related sulfurtransferase
MLIDVRSPEEYSEVHVDEAVNIPVENIVNHIDEIDSFKTVVTICWKGGGRSAKASEILRNLGYEKVQYLCNGTSGWLETAKSINNQ